MTIPSTVDPTGFADDLDRILAVLQNAKAAGIQRMSASEVSENLSVQHGLRLHWRTINATLLAKPDLADRRKQHGKWLFRILRNGAQRVAAPPSALLFVEPAKAVQAVLTLHGLLGQCAGVVRVCDPYFDDLTLQHLDACAAATEIRVLTRNVKDSGSVRALHAAFHAQGRNLQVRAVAANILHDRYIIDGSRMRILGTSLNGFGKKQCFVIEAGGDIRAAMVPVFDGHWATAKPWP